MLKPRAGALFSAGVWDLMRETSWRYGGKPMDRREFLASTGGVAVAAAASIPAAQAETPRSGPASGGSQVLRMAMPWADTPQGPADSVRRLAQRFEAMTGGRYSIELGASGSPDGADLVHTSPHDFAERHPAFAYFGGLPGPTGLDARDFSHWLTTGGGQMLWDDLAATQGWKPLLAGHLGGSPPLWSHEPIKRAADLAGASVAVPGLGAAVAQALGADPLALGPDAALGALADGRVRAAEAGGLLTSLGLGAGRIARHATGDGFNGRGTTLALHVRLDTWERLGAADQAILAAAAAEEFHASYAEQRAHERIARETLATAFGVTFAPWPSDIAEALARVAEANVAHVAGTDAHAARIDHSYMAFRSAVSGTAVPRRTRPIA